MKLIQSSEIESDKCLPFILWAYLGIPHKTTGSYLYHLLCGREMKIPLDQLVQYWKGKESEGEADSLE